MQAQLGWFDFVALIMVMAGIFVGRRRGMSNELLDLALWLSIVAGGALLCPGLGRWLVGSLNLPPTPSYILAYLILASGFFLVFFLLRRGVGEKLVSSDVFGGLEYYMGMTAGAIRFMCMLLAVMAILNAPQTSKDELDRKLRVQREDLGSVYFPPFAQIQQTIFFGSFTGRAVKDYLSLALIQPDPKAKRPAGENIYRTREQLVDAAAGFR